MEQLDLFNKKQDRKVWEELHSLRNSIRGLFARFNYLEKEWITIQKEKTEEKNEVD